MSFRASAIKFLQGDESGVGGKGRRKLAAVWLAAGCILTATACGLTVQEAARQAEHADFDAVWSEIQNRASLPETETAGRLGGIGYGQYLQQFQDAARPDADIVVDASSYSGGEGVETLESFEGADRAVKTDETGYIEWKVNIPETGLYNMAVRYFPVAGKNAAIERELLIDGGLPFESARRLSFSRIWKNESEEIKTDNRGNELRPRQVEAPAWREAVFRDSEGLADRPFLFYLTAGEHTIRLVSLREPMVLESLRIYQEEEPEDYETVRKQYEEKGYRPVSGQFVKVQGENASFKSDPTLYPLYDRSSPKTEPFDVAKLKLNSIGGTNWKLPGQWIEWEVEVPEDGLYNIAVKYKQNIVRGVFVNRAVYIDGKVPFRELAKVPFYYDGGWQIKKLGEEQGDNKPFEIFLTKGKHTIAMEVTLGDLSKVMGAVENSLLELNAVYRKILMITGPQPDIFRDYQLEKQIPELIDTFNGQSRLLFAVAEHLERLTGEKGSEAAVLTKLAFQLQDLAEKPESVPSRLEAFKINIGALGTWLLQVREQPLEIDYIALTSPGEKLPRAGLHFAERAVHEMHSFFASFFNDYNAIGNVAGEGVSIDVWIGGGRDQAQVLKAMIDDTFTPQTGIQVNLKLVDMGVLLPATVANKGPDVAVQIDKGTPVNFAMRNALQDLTVFPDYEEVLRRFNPSAYTPYLYRGGLYALPEQEHFPVLFYRKDILEELGVEPPQTWDDLFALIPMLKKRHLEVALPPESMNIFAMMLFQNDGAYYKEDGALSALDSEEAMQAFERWVAFYSDYKLPVEFDFPNRFRTGEMPVGIVDYTFYNTLQVFAPEIRGLWEFAPVPGTPQEDGTIRRDVASGGTGVMMLKSAKNKEAAWTFMKWWTGKEAQVRFGHEMESILGPSARYPTANLEALEELPWPVKDYRTLQEARQWVRGIPEVPGGYFTPRHLDNAFRISYTTRSNPRETLLRYVEVINEEIKLKRKEFGIE